MRRLILLVLLAAAQPLAAQGSADVPLGDNAYVYLDALLARGAMHSLSALERPYNDINGDIGLNHVSNYQHVPGVDKNLFAGRVVVSLTWRRLLSGVFQPTPEPPE